MWNFLLSGWRSFLTYNFFFSFLAEERKRNKLCKEISMVSDALQQSNFHQNQKKKCAPVSKGCSSAKWKHPFIESGAIRALSKLKNTTEKNVLSESFRRCCCFSNNMRAERFQKWSITAEHSHSQQPGVREQGFACSPALLGMVTSLWVLSCGLHYFAWFED